MKKSAKLSRQNKGKKIAKEQLNEVSGGNNGTPQTQNSCTFYENGSICTGTLGPVSEQKK
ncbi:hypothetical protein [Legionella jamestowniensis]|uniref:Uncharacterized protein n=1 Tax=Legionella jamestowniensis TaxID=455 RepID=A0A0W0UIE1_9GAMM|nr:hypothetical protein [Legionella jamestowniensis]KTD07648.1 hypothetical protein Ljam_1843 [Legionella jamestowniensis]OCH99391.1 hypothetical protein A8135_06810 [Legionella jamestowniensis]SFL60061.1 hypothetical protein SAMN02746073_0961 [Legionella jamestowniensis DSM 19215]